MKKLTAGIFATLLAVVSVGAAHAEIASKGYVDQQVGTKADASTVTSLQGTVSEHTTQIAGKADSSTVTALDGRVDAAEGEIDALQTAVDGKQDALGFTPENSENKTTTLSDTSTDTQYPSAKAVWDTIQTETTGIASDADVTALEGRVGTLETASKTHATKTELSSGLAGKQDKLSQTGSASQPVYVNAEGKVTAGNTIPTVTTSITTGQTAAAQAGAVADALAAKANTADLADYVTKEAADADYAVKALEDQVGDVSATNMGTTATTVVTAIKEVAGEAAAAQRTATGAQNAVDTVESKIAGYGDIVTHNASEFATTGALTSGLAGKLDKTGTAAKATADADGNVITTTYATKEDIADMATDTNLALKQDKTDNSLATTSKTVVGAINEVKTTADGAKTAADAAQTDATQAINDAAEAQAEAEAKIPLPTGECSNPTAKCVLVSNGTNSFEWEVIARDGEGK